MRHSTSLGIEVLRDTGTRAWVAAQGTFETRGASAPGQDRGRQPPEASALRP